MSAVSSLSSVLGISSTSEPVTASLAELDPKTYLDKPGTPKAFQYYPEEINDSKSAEWVRKSVPGGSHPIVQFLNGGERVISFTSVFTQDQNPEGGSIFGGLDFSLSDLLGDKKHTVDVAAAIAWLRSYTYPEYDDTGAAKPPPLGILYLPGSGIIGAAGFPDSIVGAMLECNVTYQAMHRNGAPRVVAVALSFVEVVQTSKAWRFFGRESIPGLSDFIDGSSKDYFPTYVRAVVDGDDGIVNSAGNLAASAF